MPFKIHPSGLTVTVRLTPNARQAGVHGYVNLEDGQRALKVSVTAIPEDGKANKALVEILSKSWKIPKSFFSFLSGETNRTKVILVSGDGAALMAHIQSEAGG